MSLVCIEVFRVEVMLDIIRIVNTSTLPVIERKSFVNLLGSNYDSLWRQCHVVLEDR